VKIAIATKISINVNPRKKFLVFNFWFLINYYFLIIVSYFSANKVINFTSLLPILNGDFQETVISIFLRVVAGALSPKFELTKLIFVARENLSNGAGKELSATVPTGNSEKDFESSSSILSWAHKVAWVSSWVFFSTLKPEGKTCRTITNPMPITAKAIIDSTKVNPHTKLCGASSFRQFFLF